MFGWDYTHGEIELAIAGANKRADAAYELALWQAYHTGVFVMDALAVVRPKSRHRFPEWKTVLDKFRESLKKRNEPQGPPVPAWKLLKDRLRGMSTAKKRPTRLEQE